MLLSNCSNNWLWNSSFRLLFIIHCLCLCWLTWIIIENIELFLSSFVTMRYTFVLNSLCFILFSFSLVSCQETTEIEDEFSSTTDEPHSKLRESMSIIFLPPVFNVIGATLLIVSSLTTLVCVAYFVFLPWAHAFPTNNNLGSVTANVHQSGKNEICNQNGKFEENPAYLANQYPIPF